MGGPSPCPASRQTTKWAPSSHYHHSPSLLAVRTDDVVLKVSPCIHNRSKRTQKYNRQRQIPENWLICNHLHHRCNPIGSTVWDWIINDLQTRYDQIWTRSGVFSRVSRRHQTRCKSIRTSYFGRFLVNLLRWMRRSSETCLHSLSSLPFVFPFSPPATIPPPSPPSF